MDTGSVNWRPETVDGTLPKGHTTDLLDRRQPRRLVAARFFEAVPGLMRQFGPIPPEFWTQDVNGDGYTEAVVACPCREEPRVEVGCLERCECERFYWYDGRQVSVGNGPKGRANAQTAAAS